MNNIAIDEKLIAVLNDLVMINNDRIEGYEKAAAETNDMDLQGIFKTMANDSRMHVAELKHRIHDFGGEVEEGTTAMGKVYRAWMDIKATFAGKERASVLESCEFGEDAAQKAYTNALASDADIDVETRQIITSQKASLKESHDTIKRYRDVNKG